MVAAGLLVLLAHGLLLLGLAQALQPARRAPGPASASPAAIVWLWQGPTVPTAPADQAVAPRSAPAAAPRMAAGRPTPAIHPTPDPDARQARRLASPPPRAVVARPITIAPQPRASGNPSPTGPTEAAAAPPQRASGAGPSESPPKPADRPASAPVQAAPQPLDLRWRAPSAEGFVNPGPAAQAAQDPRLQGPRSASERFARSLGIDQRLLEVNQGNGQRQFRRGGDCLKAQPARTSQLHPMDSTSVPQQVGPC